MSKTTTTDTTITVTPDKPAPLYDKKAVKAEFKQLLLDPEKYAKDYNLDVGDIKTIKELNSWQKAQMWNAVQKGIDDKLKSDLSLSAGAAFIKKQMDILTNDMQDLEKNIHYRDDFYAMLASPESLKYDLEPETIATLKSLTEEQQKDLWKAIKKEEHLYDNEIEEFFGSLAHKILEVGRKITEKLLPLFTNLGVKMLDVVVTKAIDNDQNISNELKVVLHTATDVVKDESLKGINDGINAINLGGVTTTDTSSAVIEGN